MRSFVATPSWSEHDQFFATFGRFGGLNKTHIAEWVDEVASRSAAENNQYLELMHTPTFSHAAQIAHQIGWNAQARRGRPAGIRAVPPATAGPWTARRSRRGSRRSAARPKPAASKWNTAERRRPRRPARWRFATSTRCCAAFAPEQVFAQTLLGFETVQASMDANDGTWVGINFVQPEDGYISMRDYTLQMKMVGYLHSIYPEGAHLAACGRAGAGAGAAGGTALPYSPGGGAGRRGADRPRRGRDV